MKFTQLIAIVLVFLGSLSMAATDKKVHLLSIGIERLDVGLEAPTRINDFDASQLPQESWFDKLSTNLKHYMVIHPYFLKTGKNDLQVTYWISDPREVDMGTYQLIMHLTDMDYENLKSEKSIFKLESPEMTKTDEPQNERKTLSKQFEFKEKLPEWSWIKDPKIKQDEATKKSLLAEYHRLWTTLKNLGDKKSKMSEADKKAFAQGLKDSTKEFAQASEMRGKKYTVIDDMINMAGTMKERNLPVVMRPLDSESKQAMKLFANGTRAKIIVEPDSTFERDLNIQYVGGAHDANPGPAGDNFCFWFKKDPKGNWVVDAVIKLGALTY